MQYWDAMHDKFGFDDGEAIPAGAELYRTVYVRYLNVALKRLGSSVRVVAYNRPGVHNHVLICCLPAQVVDQLSLAEIESGEVEFSATDESDLDRAYFDAVDQAIEADLDQYVEVTTEISSEFEKALREPGL
jgi:hypothetical protein